MPHPTKIFRLSWHCEIQLSQTHVLPRMLDAHNPRLAKLPPSPHLENRAQFGDVLQPYRDLRKAVLIPCWRAQTFHELQSSCPVADIWLELSPSSLSENQLTSLRKERAFHFQQQQPCLEYSPN